MPSRRERKRMRRKGKDPSKKSDDSSPDDSGDKEEKKTRKRGAIKKFYEDKYKWLLIVPFAFLLTAFVIIGTQIITTGTFVAQDVSLKGGLSINTLTQQDISPDQLEEELFAEFPQGDFRVRSISEAGDQRGLIIDASDVEQDPLVSFLTERIPGFEDNHSMESIGPSLGENFFKQTMIAIAVAFVFMAGVVFYYFRTLVPSGAVVLAAFSDIVVTIGVMNVLDIRLSTAGIAALLMLIGYSVDTDILLSTRVLKRKQGTTMERMYSAINTGITMNVTTLSAITVALILSQSETISQIMTILLIGLLIDVVNTWLQNTGILRMYVESKGEWRE